MQSQQRLRPVRDYAFGDDVTVPLLVEAIEQDPFEPGKVADDDDQFVTERVQVAGGLEPAKSLPKPKAWPPRPLASWT